MQRTLTTIAFSMTAALAPVSAQGVLAADRPAPLQIGETFTMASSALGERRRINVYLPPQYADTARLPVLYMPDGGVAEDFIHVAGLVQVLVGNGSMRPFILVGIENTERRRDMTGPTSVAADRQIAPRVGGSAAFRTYLRTELMPLIRGRYRTTAETAIVGESLAGLFVVETLLLEPTLFDSYLAFDPSLWWNGGQLVRSAGDRFREASLAGKSLYLASSGNGGLEEPIRTLMAAARCGPTTALRCLYEAMPSETHATIYHPAALRAFRVVFAPKPGR
jgi:uncharacterized protein